MCKRQPPPAVLRFSAFHFRSRTAEGGHLPKHVRHRRQSRAFSDNPCPGCRRLVRENRADRHSRRLPFQRHNRNRNLLRSGTAPTTLKSRETVTTEPSATIAIAGNSARLSTRSSTVTAGTTGLEVGSRQFDPTAYCLPPTAFRRSQLTDSLNHGYNSALPQLISLRRQFLITSFSITSFLISAGMKPASQLAGRPS